MESNERLVLNFTTKTNFNFFWGGGDGGGNIDVITKVL
jgi:hypothetical protein